MSSEADRVKWNNRYQSMGSCSGPPPAAEVLSAHQYLLPNQGVALDLACGLGANAVLLARHGLETYAWDISNVAILSLSQLARAKSLKIHTEVRDVVAQPPPEEKFDIIIVSRFLNREIIPSLIRALKPHGLVFYQTFIRQKKAGVGPNNIDFLLKENELLALFSDLNIVLYREEGGIGDLEQGVRNEAMLIAQKIK